MFIRLMQQEALRSAYGEWVLDDSKFLHPENNSKPKPLTLHLCHIDQTLVRQEAWKSALSRAGGERVLDDPKLLRRSLKKEAKVREKHTKGWKERNHNQKQEQDKRQGRWVVGFECVGCTTEAGAGQVPGQVLLG